MLFVAPRHREYLHASGAAAITIIEHATGRGGIAGRRATTAAATDPMLNDRLDDLVFAG